MPCGVVDVGGEVLDAVFSAGCEGLLGGSVAEERGDVGAHCGAAGGVAACAYSAAVGVELHCDLVVDVFGLDAALEHSGLKRSELHDGVGRDGAVEVVVAEPGDVGVVREGAGERALLSAVSGFDEGEGEADHEDVGGGADESDEQGELKKGVEGSAQGWGRDGGG